jgi:Tfp pilus assembly PilM family ATPase
MSLGTSQITVGLDIGYDAVRMVAIEAMADGPCLRRIGERRLPTTYTPQTLFDNGAEISKAIQAVIADGCDPSWPVVIGLRNRFATVMIPHIGTEVPSKSVHDWIMWEAEQFTDDSISNYIVDISWTEHATDAGRDAFVVAARHEAVEALEAIALAAETTPVGMTVATAALINSFHATQTLTEWESAAVAHIEPGAIDIIFMRDNSLNLTVMPLDSHHEDSDKAIEAFGTQFRHLLNVMPEEDAPDTVYISSVRKDLTTLCERWSEELNRRIQVVEPFQGMEIDPAVEGQLMILDEASFMVAAGLALQPGK